MAYGNKTKASQLPVITTPAGHEAVGSRDGETFRIGLNPISDGLAEIEAKSGEIVSPSTPIIVTSGITDVETVGVWVRTDDEDNFSVQDVGVTLAYTDSGGTVHSVTHRTDSKGHTDFRANKRNVYTLTTESFDGYVQGRTCRFMPSEDDDTDGEYAVTYRRHAANDMALTVQAAVVGEGKSVGGLANANTFAHCALNDEMKTTAFNASGSCSYTLNRGKDYEIGFEPVSGFVRPESICVTADAAAKTVNPQYTTNDAFVFVLSVPEGTSSASGNFAVSVTAMSGESAIVNWGDGTAAETGASKEYSHAYAPGEYVLCVEKASNVCCYGKTGSAFVKKLKAVNPDTLSLLTGVVRQCSSLKGVDGISHCTSIEDYACYQDAALETVGKITACTSIGSHAFAGCPKLGGVNITSACTSIGAGAFSGDSSLTEAGTLSSCTTLGANAFDGCSKLTSAGTLTACTSVGDSCFSGCTALTTATLTTACTSVGSSAFRSCAALKSVGNLSAVTQIRDYSFYECILLSSAGTLTSCTSVGGNAFSGCVALTTASLTSLCTAIGASAFGNCTKLTTIGNVSQVTALGNGAFSGCIALTSAGSLSSCTSVGESAFEGCLKLTTAQLTSACTTIGEKAFYGCLKLTTLGDLSGLTSVGTDAFYNCTSLTTLTFTSKAHTEVEAIDGFGNFPARSTCVFYCTDGRYYSDGTSLIFISA